MTAISITGKGKPGEATVTERLAALDSRVRRIEANIKPVQPPGK